ncbi:ArnT family glycosyltransferase [Paenibacillus chartarius]|uniref:ArnT family glycosyltransferase n=1 Tax=Paenibacillus chartarius TaxID=747481 RepID=A0ABV6DTX6_9BACL
MSRWIPIGKQHPLAALLWSSFLLKAVIILLEGSHYSLQSDDVQYIRTARIWLQTGMFTYNDPTQPTLFITPGYPAFLAAMMAILGDTSWYPNAVRLVQAAIFTASLLILHRIGLRLVGQRAALGAVALCAFSPSLNLVANLLLTEALFLPLILILTELMLRLYDKPRLQTAILFGIAWAAAIYVRPTIAPWPGLMFLLLLLWQHTRSRRRTIVLSAVVAGVIVLVSLTPWWVRNYHVSGTFVPLTQAGGNPLLLGTFPFIPPTLEEQRSWHPSTDLRANDRFDSEWAKQRIKDGFRTQPLLYTAWYTVGKFLYLWGDVYYWISLAGLPLSVPILYHYAIVIPGAIGLWRLRKRKEVQLLLSLLGMMTALYMIYLTHSRYAIPFIPLLSLFSAAVILGEKPTVATKEEVHPHVS